MRGVLSSKYNFFNEKTSILISECKSSENLRKKKKKCYALLKETKTGIIFLRETHFIKKNEKKVYSDFVNVEEFLFFLS